MTRVGTLVATTGVAGAFGALITGSPLVATAAFLAVALAGATSGWASSRVVPDNPWASPAPATVTTPASERRAPPSSRHVARSLGRIEARELALHPWFGAGVGLCTFMALGFGLGGDADGTWENELQDLTFLAHPLVGMAVVAAHTATTRSSRSGTVELFASCSATPSSRTLGALGAMWVPSAVLAVFFAAYVAALNAADPDLTAPTGPVALHVASGLTLGAGGVALGVALGRWVRFALAPVVAIVAVGFVSLHLAGGSGNRFESSMLLSTFPPVGEDTVLLTTGQMAWHLLWLLAITAATCTVALPAPRRYLARQPALLVRVGAGE